MHLPLNVILAYLDNILDQDQRRQIEMILSCNPQQMRIVHRIRDLLRRGRLGSPEVLDTEGLDPNTVAEYLDQTLPETRIPDFERVCLDSDIHLTETAAVHQVLALVLGEPALVSPEGRRRMYRIAQNAAHLGEQADPDSPSPPATPADTPDPATTSVSAPVQGSNAPTSDQEEPHSADETASGEFTRLDTTGHETPGEPHHVAISARKHETDPDESHDDNLRGDESHDSASGAETSCEDEPCEESSDKNSPRMDREDDGLEFLTGKKHTKRRPYFMHVSLVVLVGAGLWAASTFLPSPSENRSDRASQLAGRTDGDENSPGAAPLYQPPASEPASKPDILPTVQDSAGSTSDAEEAVSQGATIAPSSLSGNHAQPSENAHNDAALNNSAAQNDSSWEQGASQSAEDTTPNNYPTTDSVPGQQSQQMTEAPATANASGEPINDNFTGQSTEYRPATQFSGNEYASAQGSYLPPTDTAFNIQQFPQPSTAPYEAEPNYTAMHPGAGASEMPLTPSGTGMQQSGMAQPHSQQSAIHQPVAKRFGNPYTLQSAFGPALFARELHSDRWQRAGSQLQTDTIYATPLGFDATFRITDASNNSLIVGLSDGARVRFLPQREPGLVELAIEEGRVNLQTMPNRGYQSNQRWAVRLHFDDIGWRFEPADRNQPTDQLDAAPREGIISLEGAGARVEAQVVLMSRNQLDDRSNINRLYNQCELHIDPGTDGSSVRWESRATPSPMTITDTPATIRLASPYESLQYDMLSDQMPDDAFRRQQSLGQEAADSFAREICYAKDINATLTRLSRQHPNELIRAIANNGLIITQQSSVLQPGCVFTRIPAATGDGQYANPSSPSPIDYPNLTNTSNPYNR